MVRLLLALALAGCTSQAASVIPRVSSMTTQSVTQDVPRLNGIYYALGDGITNNPIDGTPNSYPAVLGKRLGITVQNLGVTGQPVGQVLVEAVPKIGADCSLLTLLAGGADLIDKRIAAAQVEPVFIEVFRAAKVRCPGGMIVLATYIDNATQPVVHDNVETYNQFLRSFAIQNRVPLVDLDHDKRFNDPPFPSPLMYNWAHPNDAGMIDVAQDFQTVIQATENKHA